RPRSETPPPGITFISRYPARLPGGQVRQIGARLLLLLLGVNALCGALQELEDVLHHVAARGGWLDSRSISRRCRSTSLSTTRWSVRQASRPNCRAPIWARALPAPIVCAACNTTGGALRCNWMARVQRPAIQANIEAETARLDEPLLSWHRLQSDWNGPSQNLLTSPRCAST